MAIIESKGQSLPFRMSESKLQAKMEEFEQDYSTGAHGMVSWPMFCGFLGYSVEDVRDCYLRGKESWNAYTGRSKLLEVFYTRCKGWTVATCNRQQALAKSEVQTDYLRPPADTGGGGGEVRILFGNGDDRWVDALK